MGIFVSAIQKQFSLKMMENLTFKIHSDSFNDYVAKTSV